MQQLTTLARNVRLYRMKRGLTQKELMDLSQVQSIPQLEAGYRDGLRTVSAIRVAKALQVSVSDLYDDYAR